MLCETETRIRSAPSKYYPQLKTWPSLEQQEGLVASSGSLVLIYLEVTIYKARNRGNRAVKVWRGGQTLLP